MAVSASPAVVLTREPEDNRSLADALAAGGVPVRQIPCLATRYLEPGRLPDGIRAVTFSSRRGVVGLQRAGAARAWMQARGSALVGAVGRATAAALDEAGWPADLIADPPLGEVLARRLIERIEAGAPIATVQGNLRAGGMDAILAGAGFDLHPVEVYENVDPLVPRLEPFAVAAVFVASPSAAKRLLAANPWLAAQLFVAIGPTTAAALAGLGVARIELAGKDPEGWPAVLIAAHRRVANTSDSARVAGGNMSTKRRRSQQLYTRACQVMPGGVSSPVRAFRSVGGTPVYYQKAAGARFEDVDGNEYLDFCLSWGPLILGHAHPAVVEAVRAAAADGLSFGACCEKEIRLAELVLSAFDSMGQVRFVSSGTEAVMTAIRLARGVTARPKIIKFEGGYHGHSDSLLVKAGSGLATFGTSSSAGVPAAFAAETIVLPLDDETALEQAFAAHGPQVAAAVVEPLPANNGLLEQRPEWLAKLRALTREHGALLIFDEVISGFRFRFGGYGQVVGVEPDLVTLGKIIGGGMPVGAVTGPRELMEALAPTGEVYQAGTLSGNPVSLAAGIATLELLADGQAYSQLEELGRHLDAALAERGGDLPTLRWRRVGSLMWFHLAEGEPPRAAAGIKPEAAARFNPLHAPLLDAGVYLAPSAYEMLFWSTAHTRADVERLAEAFVDALRSE